MNKWTRVWHASLRAVAPIFGGVIMLWLLWNIEQRTLPVAIDFRITHATLTKNGYTAAGTLNKVRSCQLINLAVIKVSDGVPAAIMDTQSQDLFSPDAATGTHAWGPTTLPLTDLNLKDTDEVRIIALHRCHAFWYKQTEYMRASWSALKLLAIPKPAVPVPPAGQMPMTPMTPNSTMGTTHYFIRVAPISDRY